MSDMSYNFCADREIIGLKYYKARQNARGEVYYDYRAIPEDQLRSIPDNVIITNLSGVKGPGFEEMRKYIQA